MIPFIVVVYGERTSSRKQRRSDKKNSWMWTNLLWTWGRGKNQPLHIWVMCKLSCYYYHSMLCKQISQHFLYYYVGWSTKAKDSTEWTIPCKPIHKQRQWSKRIHQSLLHKISLEDGGGGGRAKTDKGPVGRSVAQFTDKYNQTPDRESNTHWNHTKTKSSNAPCTEK